MANPSLTSNKPASKDQAKRVRTLTMEAAESALEDNAFTHDELQAVHANAGPYKAEFAESFIAFLRAFSRKVRGIVTPRRAEETGLVPANWRVKTDQPEGEVDLARLDYDYCPVHGSETYTGGDTMLERAATAHAIGSLGFAHELLKAQDQGKEIFPVESRGVHYFVMPLTVLLDARGGRPVAYFRWNGERWVLHFNWLDDDVFDSCARLVRVREAAAATAKAGE